MDSPKFVFTSECPVVCLDGILLACSSVAQTCVPRAAISKELLINLLKEDIAEVTEGRKVTEMSALRKFLLRRGSTGQKQTAVNKRRILKQERDGKCRSWGPGEERGVLMGLDRISNSPAVIAFDKTGKNTEEEHSAKVQNLRNKRMEFEKSIAWIRSEHAEYITTEKLRDIEELDVFLGVLLRCKTPSLLEAEVNNTGEIIVTYQLLYGFRNEYMMVKINSKYSLLMRTF